MTGQVLLSGNFEEACIVTQVVVDAAENQSEELTALHCEGEVAFETISRSLWCFFPFFRLPPSFLTLSSYSI